MRGEGDRGGKGGQAACTPPPPPPRPPPTPVSDKDRVALSSMKFASAESAGATCLGADPEAYSGDPSQRLMQADLDQAQGEGW